MLTCIATYVTLMFLQQQCLLQTIWGTTDEVSGLQHQQQLAVCRLKW